MAPCRPPWSTASTRPPTSPYMPCFPSRVSGKSRCAYPRDEAPTIGPIVSIVRSQLSTLVDEVLVIDDGSSDTTGSVAADAGARVVAAAALLPEMEVEPGKGQAMWKAVFAAEGDLIVFCDADVTNFQPSFVAGLLGPLLLDRDGNQVALVKASYNRPLNGLAGEGGRVTELVARPLLSALFPELAHIRQPLSGEAAAPRWALEQLPFCDGYGVELGLLVDVAAQFGPRSIAQVELGERRHRNRPIHELSPQALAILQVALRRAGAVGGDGPSTLLRPDGDPRTVVPGERPPLVGVPSYRTNLERSRYRLTASSAHPSGSDMDLSIP